MAREEPAEIAPEVFADPLAEDPEALPDAAEPPGAAASALVPSRDRALTTPDPFHRYLSEIRRYAPLTREEEHELARRYRESRDREALFRLVTSNLMLVVRIALSFKRAARSLLDLIQEGNVGLLQAIERFDPEVGVRLPTYAAWWIRAYIVKFLLDNVRQVRVGTTNARRKLLHNLGQEKLRLEAQGFEAGPRLLAERFGVSEEDVREVQQALQSRDLALDAPLGEGDDRTHADVLAADAPDVEEEVARKEMQLRAQEAIGRFRDGLAERDRVILDQRILADEPITLQEIGDRFGTTREAARQAEAKLMGRLREHLKKELGDFGSVHIGPA